MEESAALFSRSECKAPTYRGGGGATRTYGSTSEVRPGLRYDCVRGSRINKGGQNKRNGKYTNIDVAGRAGGKAVSSPII